MQALMRVVKDAKDKFKGLGQDYVLNPPRGVIGGFFQAAVTLVDAGFE